MIVEPTVETILKASLGGVMIGIASACFLMFNGRISGISGILGGLFRKKIPQIFDSDHFFSRTFNRRLCCAPTVAPVICL